MDWQPTHVAPNAGMNTWPSPSPTAPMGPPLDGDLPVAVAARDGAWAQVTCSNGWSAWVDGRLLREYTVDSEPSSEGVPLPARSGVGRGPAAALRVFVTPRVLTAGSSPLAVVGLLALPGAVLVLAGSFLPLVSVEGLLSVSAWDVPAQFLFTDNPDPSGFKLGILLLPAALVVLPLLVRRPLPPIALLLIAAPATNTGVHLILRSLSAGAAYPSLGIGALMITTGGFLMTGEALWSIWAGRRRAFQ